MQTVTINRVAHLRARDAVNQTSLGPPILVGENFGSWQEGHRDVPGGCGWNAVCAMPAITKDGARAVVISKVYWSSGSSTACNGLESCQLVRRVVDLEIEVLAMPESVVADATAWLSGGFMTTVEERAVLDFLREEVHGPQGGPNWRPVDWSAVWAAGSAAFRATPGPSGVRAALDAATRAVANA